MKVALHSSLKHRMLGMYFKICRQVAKKRVLYYIDLYAGDGEAECDEAPLKKWDCPFIKSLLEHAKKDEIKLLCFLNEFDPSGKGYYDKLKQKVSKYHDCIIGITKEDANVVYKDVLKKIPANEWSIFFLDPYKYSDLDWDTIAGISKHEAYDSISRCRRKPELIINLATYTMQRAFMHDPEGITKCLGTEEWKDKIENKSDEKNYEIFSELFIKRLENLGYQVTSFCIKQTLPLENTLYYIFFASSIPNANEIITKNYKPYIDRLMKDRWVKENFTCRMITRAIKRGNKLIGDFINQ